MNIQSKLYLFAILLFAVASCNKDDDPVITGSIVGQWRMTDIHANDGVSEITFLGQTETGTYTFHGTDYNTSTTFTENPNEFSSTGSYTVIADYVFQGLNEHDSLNVYAYPGTGSWSINGNKLTQILLGDTSIFDILELSDSKLRLQGIVDEIIQDTSLGLVIHDRATVFSTFEKQ